MKKLLIVFVLLLVVVVVAPFGFSFWGEKRMHSLLESINSAGVIDMTVIKMERGWFSSDVIIEAEMDPSLTSKMKKGNTQPPSLVLKNKLFHGPFPFMSGQFSAVPVVATLDTKFIKSLSNDEGVIDIDYSLRTNLLFSGKNHMKVNIPEWNGPVENGKMTVEWKGLKGDMKFSDTLDDADMNLSAPYLKLYGEQGMMLLESFRVESDSEIGIEGLSLGDAEFRIGKIVIQDKSKGVDLAIDGVNISAETGATGDNINSDVKFDVQAVTLAGDRFGPAIFTMAFRNLDAGAIARISKKYKEVSQQANIPPEQMNMMVGTTLLSEMSTLLKKGPEIEIGELSLAGKSGKLMGTAKVSVDTSRPQLLSNPLLIKDAIIGEVDVEVPEQLMVELTMAAMRQEFKTVDIQYTEEQLQTMARNRVSKRFGPLVGANIFTKAGDSYKFNGSFRNGVPVVNGQPFQIPLGGAGMPQGQ